MGKFLRSMLRALLIVLAPIASKADPYPFYWTRVDRLAETDDWALVSQSDIHRRFTCTTCEGDVTLTFSVYIPRTENEKRRMLSEATKAYRADRAEKCRRLVQNNEGRCVKTRSFNGRMGAKVFETKTELPNNQIEHEVAIPFYEGFFWADVKGPRNSPVVANMGGQLYDRLLGITPFY